MSDTSLDELFNELRANRSVRVAEVENALRRTIARALEKQRRAARVNPETATHGGYMQRWTMADVAQRPRNGKRGVNVTPRNP